MSRCTEYVPTIVEARQVHEEIPRCHRHILSSVGPAGAFTLCGQWIHLRRLRILKVDRTTHTVQVREEDQRIESREWSDVHRACAERHLLEKRRYRIGSGLWAWLWHPATPAVEVLTLDEAKHRLAALEGAVKGPRAPWWRRWLSRKEKAA